MSAILTTAVFFVLVYACAVSLWNVVSRRRGTVEDKFADLAVQVRLADRSFEQVPVSRSHGAARTLLRWARAHMAAPDADNPRAEKLSHELIKAGFHQNAIYTFHLIRVGATLAGVALGALVGWIFSGQDSAIFICAFTGFVLGIIGPTYYVKRRARIRQSTIANELSDALDLLVVSVEAGLGLNEAIKVVGTEAEQQDQVIGAELAMVSAELSSGRTMGEALRALAERSSVEDLKPLAATLIQSEQLGSQIGPALKASSDALRAKRKLRAEENAQKLSIKILVPLVFLVLPAMLMLIIGPAMIQIVRALSS